MRYALFLVLLLALPARAQVILTGDKVVLPNSRTECAEDRNGKVVGVVYLRLDLLSVPEHPTTIAHELSHKSQMERFSSCDAYHAWLREGDHAMRDEALAHWMKAQALIVVYAGMTIDQAVEHVALALSTGYPEYNLTIEDAIALIKDVAERGI